MMSALTMQSTLTLAALGLTAYFFSALMTPVARRLARRWGWLDQPDSYRKAHRLPTPRTGGVAVIIAWLAPLLILEAAGAMDPVAGGQMWGLLPALAAIFATGLMDDLRGLSPKQKLLGQTIAALLACSSGLYFRSIAGVELDPAFGVTLTVLWLVFCPNCYNLIDGVDGLAAGVGSIAAIAVVGMSLREGLTLPLLLAIPLAGALLGFLRYNFSPASIFLGDSGSLFTGFMLGCCLVLWPQRDPGLLAAAAPCFVLAVPFLDTALSVTRRLLAERSICQGDHGHLHHRLLDSGMSARAVAVTMYAGGILAGEVALVQGSGSGPAALTVAALFALVFAISVFHLYPREMHILRELPRHLQLRRRARARVELQLHAARLRGAVTPEECWQILCGMADQLGLIICSFRLGHRHFEERLASGAEPAVWTLRIQLPAAGYVTIGWPAASKLPVDSVCETLREALSTKALELALAGATPRHGYLEETAATNSVTVN